MHNPTTTPESSSNGKGVSSHGGAQSGVSREFYNFLADIEDLIKETTSLTGDELASARAKLNARVASAKATAEEVGDSIVQRAQQSASVTNAYVHEQPWKAMGAGAAIAFLLGFALARRS